MVGLRSSWWVLVCGVLGLGCGQTSKQGATEPEPGTPGGAAGAGGAPSSAEIEPSCAVILASDGASYCAAYEDGSVWCWGSDPKPVRIEVPGPVSKLFMGAGNTCAVTGGKPYCWGSNAQGQLRDEPGTVTEPIELDLGTSSPLQSLAVDGRHLCAVDLLSHVYCRGGALTAPTEVDVGSGLSLLTLPGPGTEVLDDQGLLYSLSDPENPEPITALGPGNSSIGTFSAPTCVLRRGGSLWCTGYVLSEETPMRVKVELGETVASVAVSDLFVCALSDAGRVWCEGYDQLGQTGRGVRAAFSEGDFVPKLDDAVHLAVARTSACALRKDGSVWCWGTYSPDVTNISPHEVTSCETQQATLALPSPPAAPSGYRLGDAGKARGQALCDCAFGVAAEQGCIDAEDFAPNGACLEALAPNHEAWSCRAEMYWREAQCYAASSGCWPSPLPECRQPDDCPQDETWPAVSSYCRRSTCTNGDGVAKHQLCDGNPDCLDGSDELNCVLTSPPVFSCDGEQSVPVDQMCDRKSDCDNGADEHGCL